jgi:hypothetical protein
MGDVMAKENSQQGDCTSGWSIAWSGEKRWVPFDPDMNATYWYYAFTRAPGDTAGFKFHGQFGHARYQGYNVYNDKTADLVWGDDTAHKSSLRDVDTVPDPGSKNPYLLAVPRDGLARDYTLWVVPDGSDTSNYSNFITFPQDVEWPSIYLRVYLPDQNLKGDPNSLSGGVPLPSIEAFDTVTGTPVDCPPTRVIVPSGTMPTGPGQNTDGLVRFYRLTGGGLYPNQDVAYLATVFKQIGDTVAVIKFKPPTHTDTSDPDGTISAQAMVRYWSFNIYSIKLTNVTACLADYQAVVARDGFVYLVLGRPYARDSKEGGGAELPAVGAAPRDRAGVPQPGARAVLPLLSRGRPRLQPGRAEGGTVCGAFHRRLRARRPLLLGGRVPQRLLRIPCQLPIGAGIPTPGVVFPLYKIFPVWSQKPLVARRRKMGQRIRQEETPQAVHKVYSVTPPPVHGDMPKRDEKYTPHAAALRRGRDERGRGHAHHPARGTDQ